MKWWFSKKKVEKKNYGGGSGNVPSNISGGFIRFLAANNNYDLSFACLIQFYKRCSIFAECVDMIAEAFAAIEPVLKNDDGEVVKDEQYNEFLKNPNGDMNYKDFAQHLSSMYSIAGNPFIKLIGPVSRPPIEMDIVSPVNSRLEPDVVGRLDNIHINNEFENAIYRKVRIDRKSRFRANQDNEIWHVLSFNPDRGSRNMYGVPQAESCYDDISQLIELGTHNKSLLQNGARVGGVLTTKDNEWPLSDEQFKRMQDQFDAYHAGSVNAGRPFIAENMDWKDNVMSNKDMDYENLSKNAKTNVYNRYRIPLPLVESSNQTFNNYEKSLLFLYDMAVLPHADFILSQIKEATLYRFREDHNDLILTYEQTQVKALQTRQIENIKLKTQSKVHTVNEIREDFGDEPLENGDILLRPSNEIPALEDDAYSDDAKALLE